MPIADASPPTIPNLNTYFTRLLSCFSFQWSVFVILVLGLLCSPFFKEDFDVITCWLTWTKESAGYRPWLIYAFHSDCNYPPFILYVLTVCQAVIRLAHAPQFSPIAILIVKIPNLASCLVAGWLCLTGLRVLVGPRAARLTSLAYIFCVPLWYNAVIWGQWDALASLFLIAALLSAINGRPAVLGVYVGLALSTKLIAVVILPALVIFVFRTWKVRKFILALVASILVWCVMAMPFVIAGQGHAVLASYTGAVNYFPQLTLGAFNGWQLLNIFNLEVRHQSFELASSDAQLLVGPLSAKHVGLLLFAIYVCWLSLELYRKPTQKNLIATAGYTAIAFFMLPTQVHQRYLVPAAAILALVSVVGYSKEFLAVSLASLVNQWVVLEFERQSMQSLSSGVGQGNSVDGHLFRLIYCARSVVNIIGFIWLTWSHYSRLRRGDLESTESNLA